MPAQTPQITSELVDGKLVFVAEDPHVPFCLAQGDSPESATAELRHVRADILAYLAETGQPIPEIVSLVAEREDVLPVDRETPLASA